MEKNIMNKTIDVNIPTLQELYNSLPEDAKNRRIKLYSDDNFTLDTFQALAFFYNKIVALMINECGRADKPSVSMGLFDRADTQAICHWAASDKSKESANSYNFHGQNTSQWLYAGGLLFDSRDNRFSIHT